MQAVAHTCRLTIPCSDCVTKIDAEGTSNPCEVFKSVNDTSYFKRRSTNKTFNIVKGPLGCKSNHIIYLFECKQCQYCFPYVGSTKAKFRYRINVYKSTYRKFRKKYVEKELAIVIKKSELKKCFTYSTVQKVTKVLKIGVSL